MPLVGYTHDKNTSTVTATVGPPEVYSSDRSARLCSLHRPDRLSGVMYTMCICYSCKRAYNKEFLYPLLCCNLCRMNGNCCVDFTTR